MMKLLRPLLILTALTGLALAQDVKTSSEIGGNLIPTKYFVRLQPWFGPTVSDSAKYTSTGYVKINFHPLESTKTIVLNARNITIEDSSNIQVQTADGLTNMVLMFHIFNPDNETLTLIVEEELEAGEEYIVVIWFTSYVSTNVPKGLFLSTYKDPQGIERDMISLLMQPNNARSVFPCLDEPHLKANFTLMIAYYFDSTSPSDSMKVVYNMEEDRSLWVGYYRFVTYAETSPMSTNMLSFAIVPEEW